jgi:branched-chain amino acid transport system substrate-binding protein
VLSGAVSAADAIKIGSFLSITGPASFLGEPELKTLQMYIAKLNREGGVLGQPLELIYYDVGSRADTARTFVKRLLEVDKIDLIIGGSTTGTTMAVIPLVEQAEVPFISLAGAVKIVEPVKKWVFKIPHTDRMAIHKIFTDMRDRGIHNIALISGTDDFGKLGREQARAMAEDYGIEIVADETYTAQDTSMIAQLNNIQDTAGVQAVLNLGAGHGPVIVTKDYHRLGMQWPLYQSHGVASKKYIDLAGDAPEGVRLPA